MFTQALIKDMIENTMEVFMDDFLVYGDSFDLYFRKLEQVLVRYEETKLVLS